MAIKRYTKDSKDVLILRACAPDMTSRDGFKYPRRGPVSDVSGQFVRNTSCGNGLHGWLWGRGARDVIPHYARPVGKWLVLRVERNTVCGLGGKVKFPRGSVVFCGTKREAGAYIRARRPLEHDFNVYGHIDRGMEISPSGGDKF